MHCHFGSSDNITCFSGVTNGGHRGGSCFLAQQARGYKTAYPKMFLTKEHKKLVETHTQSHTQTHTFNGPLSRTTWVSRYQKGKTSLDFTEARDGEWQWHQLGHMQICTSLQTDNDASTLALSFLQAGCPSCCPTNSIKALKGCKKLVESTM